MPTIPCTGTANYLVGQMVEINHWIGQTVIYIHPFVITEWVYTRLNKIPLFLDTKVIECSFQTFVFNLHGVKNPFSNVKSLLNRIPSFKPIPSLPSKVVANNRDCEEKEGKREGKKKKKSFENACHSKSRQIAKHHRSPSFRTTTLLSVRARFAHTRLYLAVFHDEQIERIRWK